MPNNVELCLTKILFTRDYASGTADVRQSRFLISTSASESSSTSTPYRWWVPITFAPSGGNFNDTYPKAWLREDQERSKENSPSPLLVIFPLANCGDLKDPRAHVATEEQLVMRRLRNSAESLRRGMRSLQYTVHII